MGLTGHCNKKKLAFLKYLPQNVLDWMKIVDSDTIQICWYEKLIQGSRNEAKDLKDKVIWRVE